MARIRSLKPEFGHSETLSAEHSEVHLFGALLLTYADDEGYFKAHPKLVHAACCPLRELLMSVPEILVRLNEIGYIELMTGSDGHAYGRIVNFLTHQKIAHPTASKIKPLLSPPEKFMNPPESFTPDLGIDLGSGKGNGTGNRVTDVTEESFTLDAAVSYVLVEAGLAGRKIRDVVHEVIYRELKKVGVNPKDAADAMISAWLRYDKADLLFKQGPENFYATGTWRKPESEWGNGNGKPVSKAELAVEQQIANRNTALRKAELDYRSTVAGGRS